MSKLKVVLAGIVTVSVGLLLAACGNNNASTAEKNTLNLSTTALQHHWTPLTSASLPVLVKRAMSLKAFIVWAKTVSLLRVLLRAVVYQKMAKLGLLS